MTSRGTVVVTGAARGIGEAIVHRLRSDGLRVVGVDREPVLADVSLQLDLREEAAFDAVADAVGDSQLVGLVNNAAVSPGEPTSRLTPERWDDLMAVNLRAPFFLSERLLPALSAGRGSVVHISSVHAVATSPGAAAYAAGKAGLLALARSQTVDWPERGFTVRANAIVPGAIDTPMLRDATRRTGVNVEDLGLRHPVGRIGRPEEVAAAVAFLLSEDARFISGVALPVDGGALSLLATETPQQHWGPPASISPK